MLTFVCTIITHDLGGSVSQVANTCDDVWLVCIGTALIYLCKYILL